MKKHRIEITDDLNGKPAAETITFGLATTLYEIDLDRRNATKLRKLLAPYVAAGRRQRNGRVGPKPSSVRISRERK